MLCGNKVDLRPEAVSQNRRVISCEKGERLARNHQAIFLETSSKDGSNVIEALVQLSRYVYTSFLHSRTPFLNIIKTFYDNDIQCIIMIQHKLRKEVSSSNLAKSSY